MTEKKKYRYTILDAFAGSFAQATVEADTSYEALEIHLQKMKSFGDDNREIISITITETVELKKGFR